MARRDLRRRKPFRDPKKRFLVVCEGEVTEKSYLEGMRITERLLVDIKYIGNMKPKQAVDRAVAEKEESERKAVKDPYERFDGVWCVFDVDEHPWIPAAKAKAAISGLQLAVSNPCFELWIYLHFAEQSAHIHRHKVQSLCRKFLSNFDKRVDYVHLAPLRQSAINRARKLDHWQRGRGEEGANPSTGVYKLVEAILE